MQVRACIVGLCIWFAASVLTGCGKHSGVRGSAAPQPTISGADVKNGKLVYQRECAACHGAYGVAGPVGPALKNERARRSFDSVRAIVADPPAPMPKLYPARLSAADV